jgi:hypothetical protein
MDSKQRVQAKKIGEMISILLSVMECSKKNCMKEKQAIEKNKDLIAKKTRLNLTTDVNEKTKLINELSKNNAIYKYDKCVLKNCKEIFKKLINIFKIIASDIDKTTPKYNTINKMINELNILFGKINYTKEDHKIFMTNFTEIMKELK